MEKLKVDNMKCVAEEIKRLASLLMKETGSRYVSAQEIGGEIVVGYFLDLQNQTA